MKKWNTKNSLLFLLIAFFLGALVELVGFRMDVLLLKINRTKPVHLDLSDFSGYDGIGIPLMPQEPTYSFDDLSVLLDVNIMKIA